MSYKKVLIVVVLTIILFFFFVWIFGMLTPGANLEFALGITVVLIGGSLTGRFILILWNKGKDDYENRTFSILIIFLLITIVAFLILFSKLAENPQFILFSLTVLDLFLLSGFVGALIRFIRKRTEKKLVLARTEQAHSKSELELLKSQLSPHFLFNTLNNLYGLSISEHEKVPSLLLKLSDLLRYSIYETKAMFVPLSDELEYLKNYIDFEKIRMGKRLNLHVNLADITDTDPKIAPMLLIVFIENAFKHSKNSQDEKIYIKLKLEFFENSILFQVQNSFTKPNVQTEYYKNQSGFGLENVRKRLDLLYPETHTLEIKESSNYFIINLKLIAK